MNFGHPLLLTLLLASRLLGQPPSGAPPQRLNFSPADFDRDGVVDMTDYALLRAAMGTDQSSYDLNRDGEVTLLDVFVFADMFSGVTNTTPTTPPPQLDTETPESEDTAIPPQPQQPTFQVISGRHRTTVRMPSYSMVVQWGEPFGIVSLRLEGQPHDFAHPDLPLADWEWFWFEDPNDGEQVRQKLLQHEWGKPTVGKLKDRVILTFSQANALRRGIDLEVIYRLPAEGTEFEVEYAIHNGTSDVLKAPYVMLGFPGFPNQQMVTEVGLGERVRRPRWPHANMNAEALARGVEEYGLLRQNADLNRSVVEIKGSVSMKLAERIYSIGTDFGSTTVVANLFTAHTNKPRYLTSHLYATMLDLRAGRSRSLTVYYTLKQTERENP